MTTTNQKMRLAIELAAHVPPDELIQTCDQVWDWINGERTEIVDVKPPQLTGDQILLAEAKAELESKGPSLGDGETAPLKPAKRPKAGGQEKPGLITTARRRELFMDLARKIKPMAQLVREYGLTEDQIKGQRRNHKNLFHECARSIRERSGHPKSGTAPRDNDPGIDMPAHVATPKRARSPGNTPSVDGTMPARQSRTLTEIEKAQVAAAPVRRFEPGTFNDLVQRTLGANGHTAEPIWRSNRHNWMIDGKEHDLRYALNLANRYRATAGVEPLTPPGEPSKGRPAPLMSTTDLKKTARAAHARKAGGVA